MKQKALPLRKKKYNKDNIIMNKTYGGTNYE